MKVWDRVGIELATPGSAVRLASVARHVTDCATRPGYRQIWHLFFTFPPKDSSNSKYSKTCVKRPLSKSQKLFFKTNYRLMQVKSIAECSKGSILQYFRPSLSYHLSLRSLFCIFWSGCFVCLFDLILYVPSTIFHL